MFERLTEEAGLVLSSARDAASLWGGTVLEPDHLLLGLLQQDPGLVEGLLPMGDSVRAVRREIEERVDWGNTKLPRSVDMPMSESARRAFSFAVAEADRLCHDEIGTGHLLLGLLHLGGCLATSTLHRHGLQLRTVRQAVEQLAPASPVAPETARRRRSAFLRLLPVVPDEETALRIFEAVWAPIVGREHIESHRPFVANLASFSVGMDAELSAIETQGWLETPVGGTAWFVYATGPAAGGVHKVVAVIDPGTGRILFLDPHT